MASPSTDDQVQRFVDEVLRPFCTKFRALRQEAANILVQNEDEVLNVRQQSPTWTDTNPSNPAHLLTPDDVNALWTLLFWFDKFCAGAGIDVDGGGVNLGGAQYPILVKACPLNV